LKRPRYQQGSLRREPRKNGPDVWVFRWRETAGNGERKMRKQIVGSTGELKSRSAAMETVQMLRLDINRTNPQQQDCPRTFSLLVNHYRQKELPMKSTERKTHLTQRVYRTNLERHILPRWGEYPLRKISSIEVEDWLKPLLLANSTKAKLRNVMSAVFRHAIRWGWLGQHENPIALVRVSAKRRRIPLVLTAQEFRDLLARLPDRERAIGILCATTGLRVSEVLGLKWQDIDFNVGTANVVRSVTDGHVEHCKTETSRQPVPLDELTRMELRRWLNVSAYSGPEDWMFASDRMFGSMPIWANTSRQKVLQRAAKQGGITKPIGWHMFRHTYSSLLAECSNDVKVVQELMRHAKVSTTMEIYTHARMERKRSAQSRVVDVLFGRGQDEPVIQ
jgi:integrase